MKRILYSLLALALAVSCAKSEKPTTTLAGEFEQNPPAEVFVVVPDSLYDAAVPVTNGKFKVTIPQYLKATSTLICGTDTIAFISDGTALTFADGQITSKDENSAQNSYIEWKNFVASDGTGNYDNDVEYCKEMAKKNGSNFIAVEALEIIWYALPDSTLRNVLSVVDSGFDHEPIMVKIKSGLRARAETAEGNMFIDFHIYQDPDNREGYVSFSDYVGKGKYILVDFWASWCGPCRAEVANVKAVYEKYKGDDFDVLSVAVADKASDTAKAAKQLGITWNQIVNAKHVPGDIYGFQTIPQIMLFAPDGTILKRDLYGDKIEAAVSEALGR